MMFDRVYPIMAKKKPQKFPKINLAGRFMDKKFQGVLTMRFSQGYTINYFRLIIVLEFSQVKYIIS